MRYLNLLISFFVCLSSTVVLAGPNSELTISEVQFKDPMNSKVTFASGELIEMRLALKAINHNIFNVSAKIEAADPCFVFSQNSSNYGNLFVDQALDNATNPFVFTIANDCRIQKKDFTITVIGSNDFNQVLTFTANQQDSPQIIEDMFYKVEIQAQNGSVSKTPDLDKYPEGSQVKLDAVSNNNYKFSGWTGSVQSDSSSLSLTMDHDKILIANFTPIETENVKSSDEAPVVNAGEDQTITLPYRAILKATTSMDEKRGVKVYLWCKLSGPGPIVFANPYSLITTAAFKVPGTYELLLTAVDKSSSFSGNSKITIIVNKDEQDGKFLSVF